MVGSTPASCWRLSLRARAIKKIGAYQCRPSIAIARRSKATVSVLGSHFVQYAVGDKLKQVSD